jgi:hypothetical protein
MQRSFTSPYGALEKKYTLLTRLLWTWLAVGLTAILLTAFALYP